MSVAVISGALQDALCVNVELKRKSFGNNLFVPGQTEN